MIDFNKEGIDWDKVDWDKVDWNTITLAFNVIFYLLFKTLYLHYIIISVVIAFFWHVVDGAINLRDKLTIQLYEPINYFIAFNLKMVAWAVVFTIIFYN